MSLPDTLVGLAEYGYRHHGSGRCSGCGASLEWFYTKKNRLMPFSLKMHTMISEESMYAMPSMTRYEPHFAVCPKAERFRKKGKTGGMSR
jgi:hypothetical protein